MYKHLLYLSASAALLAICLGTGVLSYKLDKTLDQVNTSLVQTQQDLSRLSQDLHGTSQNLNAVLIQAGLTSDEVRRAAVEQRAYWAKNSAETHALLTSLKRTVDDADLSIQVLAVDGDRQIVANGEQLKSSLVHVGNVADDMDRTLLHTDQALLQAAPEIQHTLEQISQTAEHVNVASNSVQLASKDIQVKVHQLTRPAKWWMSVGRAVISAGSTAGSYLAGFFK